MNMNPEWVRNRRVHVAALAAVLGLAGIVGGYSWWDARFKPPPSIFDTPVDDVLAYLTIDDFSQLPLKERLDFLLSFADRFRGLSSGESATMAAFLAGVAGPARAQLEQNVRILAKDALADGAAGYFAVPEKDRKAYIEKWTCDWVRFAERAATGKESTKTDKEILGGIDRQAAREGERAGDIGAVPALDSGGAMAFLGFWSSQVEGTASPREQGQIARFLDDVRGHFSPVF